MPPRVLPPQALVIALTPLLDPRFARAAVDLAARGFDLVMLVVSPVGVTRAALAPSPTTDLACRLWSLERRAQLDELQRRGLPVLEWKPPEPLEGALAGRATAAVPGRRGMMRLLAAVLAAVLFLAPLSIVPGAALAGIALLGLVLAATAVIAPPAWLAAAAACVFLTGYALALARGAGVNVPVAVDSASPRLSCFSPWSSPQGRHAAVDAAVVRSHIGRWLGLGGARGGGAARHGAGRCPRGGVPPPCPVPGRRRRARGRRDHRRLRDAPPRAPPGPSRRSSKASTSRLPQKSPCDGGAPTRS